MGMLMLLIASNEDPMQPWGGHRSPVLPPDPQPQCLPSLHIHWDNNGAAADASMAILLMARRLSRGCVAPSGAQTH